MLCWTLAVAVSMASQDYDTYRQVCMLMLADGILDLEFSKVLAQGSGSLYGIDSSAAMIQAAQDLCKDTSNTTFEGRPPYPR